MITCKKCLSPNCRKNGKARQKQRYLCKECGYNFVTGDERKEKGISLQTREIAVELYLLGLGLRAIGRFLNVSNVSVLTWVRAAGKKAEDVATNTDETLEVEIMELDEMWHYCKKKREKYGSGWQFVVLAKKSSPIKLVTEEYKLLVSYGRTLKIFLVNVTVPTIGVFMRRFFPMKSIVSRRQSLIR